MLTLRDPLVHALRIHPERLAVVDGDVRFSYRDFVSRTLALASGLRRLGLAQGDRVALLAANGHRYLEAFCGIPAAGFTVVPLNTRLAMPELETIVADCGARVLLTDRPKGVLAERFERVLHLPGDYDALLRGGVEPAEPPFDVREGDVAALFYTGGTTGLPKGVMLTHRNLVANAFQKALGCSLTEDDVFLASPAMFHVAGIAPLLSLIWLGGSTVMQASFEPEGCLELIAQHGVTTVMPVPTMLAAMVACQRARPRNVKSLRLLGHAGSPIATEAIEAAHHAFPDTELAQFYGATETASMVTCLRREERLIGTDKLGSCGRAVPGVEVRVLREDGRECEPGEVGEILIRGANVTLGYWGQPRATAEALRGGYYHSGDLGLLDHEGFLFVVDRKKDMIVSGGENVYSVEVEDVLYRHPDVLEAAVFGLPDDKWGEAVHAVVVVPAEAAREPASLVEALSQHCRAAIAGYKVPKRFEVQTEPLPKSGPGKILKRVLRDARTGR